MADALDILNVKPAGAPQKVPVPRPSLPSSRKKNEGGVHREVAGLVGEDSAFALPSFVPTTNTFKEKRKRDKPVHWEWKAFSNSARTDGVMFYHWQKEGVQWEDYPFARFNKQVDILTYGEREYEQYFNNPEWTKEETDALMALCRDFDLRFIVIKDRFPNPAKTVEDLKDRFYSIQTKLSEVSDRLTEENPLVLHPYDKQYEETRKQQMEQIYSRSKEAEREEQLLMEEVKKIQLLQKKRDKDRKKQAEATRLAHKHPMERPLTVTAESELMKPGSICLRSDLMHCSLDVSPKTQIKVNNVLDALSIAKPLASAATAPLYNSLRQRVVVLLEWQKALQKKKFEYENLKLKKLDLQKPAKVKKAVEPKKKK